MARVTDGGFDLAHTFVHLGLGAAATPLPDVAVLLSGRIDVIQELERTQHVVELGAAEATVNPRNVWHTTRDEPGHALFITPRAGTEHRPLA